MMGLPMASRLVRAGFTVRGSDLSARSAGGIRSRRRRGGGIASASCKRGWHRHHHAARRRHCSRRASRAGQCCRHARTGLAGHRHELLRAIGNARAGAGTRGKRISGCSTRRSRAGSSARSTARWRSWRAEIRHCWSGHSRCSRQWECASSRPAHRARATRSRRSTITSRRPGLRRPARRRSWRRNSASIRKCWSMC